MSFHFSAGQFEKPFLPKQLGNWEVPHWYPRRPRPPEIRGPTIPLAESRGRLLPRARRTAPAWGHRRTAWDYPNRITKQLADELSKEPPPGRYLDWLPKKKTDANNKIEPINKSDLESSKENILKTDFKSEEYQPGDLTEPKDKISDLLPIVEKLDLTKIENEGDKASDDEENIEKPETHEMHTTKHSNKRENNHNESRSLPIVDPFSGYARKMHMDNLLHHPLPDTMGAKDTHVRPVAGRDLNVKPYSSDWKSSTYPNEHRPLTCIGQQKHILDSNKHDHTRPATSGGEKGDKKSAKNMSPMDLAICWDFRTANPQDEPKRPKHIDGSNGSMAPAVFSMVHSPNQNIQPVPETGRSNAIFSQNILPEDFEDNRIVPSFEKDMSKNRRKNACDVPKCPQHPCYEKNHINSESNNHKSKEIKESKSKSEACDGIHGCGTESLSSEHSKVQYVKNKKLNSAKVPKKAWEEIANKNGNLKENHSPNAIPINKIDKNIHKQRGASMGHLNHSASTQSLNERNKSFQSSPNISKHGINSNRYKDDDFSSCNGSCPKTRTKNNNYRSCMACNNHTKKSNDVISKPEYKMAFKAGNPNSSNGSESKNGDNSSNSTKNSLKVPKMRDPYTKKSYAIPTLAPPFNRWHDTSGYPEHWRLASVYQHAYKTPGPKRRPLLPAVYQ